MGGRHGLPCGSLYRRGFAATRVARRFRIYEGARRLLRCRNGLVRPSARLADRSALDTLYDRSRPGPFGRYQGADGSGRPGDRADALHTIVSISSVRNNGCELLANRLRYEGGAYTIDFDDLETKASDPKAKLLLLCNPHNPVGRVWTREELRRLGEICLRHGVRVVADEIHCELTYEGHDYTPFASLSDDFLHGSVTCNSPSKAFNLAGMQIANIVSADADVRTGIDRAINDNEVCDVNPFGVEALMAAYDRGEEWLDRLREYLADNYRMLCGFFAEYLPQYPVLPLEGTYLVWIDCRTTGVSSEQIAARLLAEAKLMISPGTIYGPGGEDFIRLNIACPGSLLEEGLLRLRKVLGR